MSISLAQITVNLGESQLDKGIPADTNINSLLGNAFTIIFTIAALLVLTFLVWGAIEWITSGGDKEKVANARKRITNALVGMVLLAVTFFIVAIVGFIIGFNVLGGLSIPALNSPPPPAPLPPADLNRIPF